MGSFFLIYSQRNRPDDTAWETCFHQLEGETEETARAETKDWVRNSFEDNPDCIYPVVLFAELKDIYKIQTGLFGNEEDVQPHLDALARALKAARGNIEGAFEILRKEQQVP